MTLLAAEQIIHIEQIPEWLFIPFAAVLAATITWVVRWILRTPKPGGGAST